MKLTGRAVEKKVAVQTVRGKPVTTPQVASSILAFAYDEVDASSFFYSPLSDY